MVAAYLVGRFHTLRAAEIHELPHPVGLPAAACLAALATMKMQPVF
jgi:hypothetical protein